VTAAQDYHGGTVEIELDVPLKKIGDGMRVQNTLHVQSSKLTKLGQAERHPLSSVDAENGARFDAHFT